MKIAFTGDLVLQELRKDPKYIFGDLRQFIIANNIRLCLNLESPFVTSGMKAVKNKITLHANTQNVKYIKFLAPSLVNLSNNHVNDYGDCSGRLTCDILENNKIPYYGIGYPGENKCAYIDKEAKLIQLAFTTRSADLSGEKLFSDLNFIGPYPPDLSLIESLRNKHTDHSIVVNIHWGIENITYPEPEKRELAYKIIDAGADLIIGHHPHIIQPVEKYKGKYIYYSLGNFYFSDIIYHHKGILKHKKSKRHQREGLFPVFDVNNGVISREMTLKVKIIKSGQLRLSVLKNNKFIPNNTDFYAFLHKYYLIFFTLKRLTKIVLKNPKLILKKYVAMKSKLKELEKTSDFYAGLFYIPRFMVTWYKTKVMSDKRFIKSQYKRVFGVPPNLKRPVTFTEKMQWLKLYDRNPLYVTCADKYEVRNFVKERIGEEFLIPLIYASDNPSKIPFDELPSEYIIKTNHTSGYNMVHKDGKICFFSNEYDFEKNFVINTLQKWLRKNVFFTNREWEYKNIPPKIIVEKLLHDESNNDLLNDYKIHCFDGNPKFIQTIFDRNEGIKENWFDTNWSPVDLYYFSNYKKEIGKPENLNELLRIAEKLSEGFNYVRVDLYSINQKVLFGELTFHPYGGLMKFQPDEWDLRLGKLIKLPTDEQ